MSKKVAIYARISTIDQASIEFNSLDAPIANCKKWIEPKDDHKLFKVYKDTKSGKDLNRPGVTQLLNDALSGKFDNDYYVIRVCLKYLSS